MKTAALFLMFLFSAIVTASTVTKSAMSWQCSGTDITTASPVTFDLVLADHDGSDYTHKSLDNFVYDGETVDSVDLTIDKVVCGKDDEGNDRIGPQYWDIQNNSFTFYSGCENESIYIEATCTPR